EVRRSNPAAPLAGGRLSPGRDGTYDAKSRTGLLSRSPHSRQNWLVDGFGVSHAGHLLIREAGPTTGASIGRSRFPLGSNWPPSSTAWLIAVRLLAPSRRNARAVPKVN